MFERLIHGSGRPDLNRSGASGTATRPIAETARRWASIPDKPYLLISLLLAFTGGFADAGSYILVDTFAGHITGNAMLLMIDVVRADWPHAVLCLVAIPAFLIGTAAGAAWLHPPHHSPCRRLFPRLALELLLVAVSLAVGPGERIPFLLLAGLALGLQNGSVGKIASVSYHTTFITGLSTTLVTSFAGPPDAKRTLLPAIIASFLVGGLCGAYTVDRGKALGFAAVLVPLTLALLIALQAGLRSSPRA